MDRSRAVRIALRYAEKAFESGSINAMQLGPTAAGNVADFIEILAGRIEKMDAPGENY